MRKKGTGFMILGLLLIAAALGLSSYNIWTDTRAEAASLSVIQQIQEIRPEQTPNFDATTLVSIPDMELPDYVRVPEMEMPVQTLNGYDYIGTLEIPALELELPIISQWDYPSFQVAPCRYMGSAYLDNMILAAHNYPSHFGRIKELQEGDALIFTDMDGNVFTYRVAAQEILEADDVEGMENSGYALTLFTCTIGGKYRVTLRCDRVVAEL